MGGTEVVLAAVKEALASQEYQWAIELADILLAAGSACQQARQYKAQGLTSLAQMETSANGRNYYFSCAQELLAQSSDEQRYG